MKNIKTKMLGIRISLEDHAAIFESAKKNGFDSLSSFVLWLWRKHGK